MARYTGFAWLAALLLATLSAFASGCGNNRPAAPTARQGTAETDKPDSPAGEKPATESADASQDGDSPAPAKRPRFRPIELTEGSQDSPVAAGDSAQLAPEEHKSQRVIDALQPFQILLGRWRWVTRKKFGDFPKTGDDVEWIWDFQTDKARPSIAIHSDAHPYLHEARLTYEAESDQFEMHALTPEGERRTLKGTWADGGQPHEESDGKTLQRRYKLQLSQTEPADGDQWLVILSQLDNNQYLIDLRKRASTGKQFAPLDTVRQQRVGTSFALADSDNPGPKCIISGGLGSMSVTYKGRSYPVCCSGCAAAFNDDPERWLARLARGEAAKNEGK